MKAKKNQVAAKSQCIIKEGKVMRFIDLNEFNEESGCHLVDYDFVQNEMNHMLGEVLTVIDASVTGAQNKAVKDIVKGIFVDEYCKLTELMHTKETFEEMTTIDDDNFQEVTEASVDEALGIK